MTKANEEVAIKDAYEQELRGMYSNFLTAIIMPNANLQEACERFRNGLRWNRKALELVDNMISE